MSSKSGLSTSTDNYKIVILGKPGVGKSALAVRFMTGKFIWDYDPTLEGVYKHTTTLDEETIAVEVLDTAGQVELSELEAHVRWGDGFMLVYSVDDRLSFEHARALKRYLDDTRRARNVSCVLVGNKIDLACRRRVSSAECDAMAAELACAGFETSASEGVGEIGEAFRELCREVKRRRALEGKSRRRSSAQQMKQVLNKMLTKIQTG